MYPKVLDEIKSKTLKTDSFNILEQDKEIILKMLINNKTRHRRFREETFARTFSNIPIELFLNEPEKFNISAEELRRRFKSHVFDKNNLKNLYNVYQYKAEIDSGRKKIYELLKTFKWEMLLIKDDFNSFFTSDNPGFTKLHSGIIINFGHWAYADSYYFPLTSKTLLKINFTKVYENIESKEIFLEEIDEINLNTFNTKIDNFYCCSKSYIQHFKNYKLNIQ